VAQVESGQPFMVWVWILKISPKNVKFFNFFLSGQKKLLWVGWESTRVEAGLASYLLQVKCKLGSGQGPSLLSRVRAISSHYGQLFDDEITLIVLLLWIFLKEKPLIFAATWGELKIPNSHSDVLDFQELL